MNTKKKKNNLVRRVLTKILNLYFKVKFKTKVLNTPTVTLQENSDVVLCMLSCHKNVIESIACLKSFYRFFDQNISLHYHDDGTLTQVDYDLLKKHFLNIKIINPETGGNNMREVLTNKGYNKSVGFREENKLYRRLYDFSYFADGKTIIQIDSDILFFQKPYEIIEAIENNTTVYNLDRGRAYSFSDINMENFIGKKMPVNFNAGLIVFKADFKNICKFCEKFLALNLISERDWVQEQTIFAMYLSQFDCKPLPRKYDLAYHYIIDFENYCFADVVSQHYCAWARNMHKIDFLNKVYPFLVEENIVNKHYRSIIDNTLTP